MTTTKFVNVAIPFDIQPENHGRRGRGADALGFRGRHSIKTYFTHDDFIRVKMLTMLTKTPISTLNRFIWLQIAEHMFKELSRTDYDALREQAIQEIADVDERLNG